MDILVTIPEGSLRETFFPPRHRDRIESLGSVTWNERDQNLSSNDLSEAIPGVDVLVTGWGSPEVTPAVLAEADDLALIAHTGGSVRSYVSAPVYDEGITVVSANDVMATYTAEHAFASVLSKLRAIPTLDADMKDGGYGADDVTIRSLHETEVGLIGLGTIGRTLLDHLRSFDVEVSIYDPYVDPSDLAEVEFARLTDFETALDSAVVSVHAARTPETIGMIDAEALATIPDGALFVNTARAELVEEEALLAELRSGRIDGAFDVYHDEPLPEGHELRSMDNVLLTPHVGGSQIRAPLTEAILDDIERFACGDDVEHAIPRAQWETMTR